MIHKSIGVKTLFKILHILPISRDLFFNNPLLFKILLLFTTEMRNSINVCDRRNHCAVCFFRARVRSAPQRTNLSFTAGCKAHFLPVGAHPNMAAGLNYSSKRGEAVVTVLPHGRTRKREPQSAKPSHLSNYGSTLCVIRVKR